MASKLQTISERTYGDSGKRERVSYFDIRTDAAHHFVACVEADGSENVSLFTVGISKERDVRRTVGIVLNALNRCGNAVLAPEPVFTSRTMTSLPEANFLLIILLAIKDN